MSLPPILSPLIHSGPLKTLVRPMIIGLLQQLEQTPDKTKESINFFYLHSSLWNFLVCLKVSGLEFREGEYLYILCSVISSLTSNPVENVLKKEKVISDSGDPMDCGPPGSSVHGILQVRILEWVAMPSYKGSSQPRDQTQVFCITGSLLHCRWILY